MNNNIFAYFFVFIFCTLFLLFAGVLSNIIYPIKYYEEIKLNSNKYGVETSLILSVMKAESNFNENAISKRGAMGLMQLMPSTASFIANKIDLSFKEDDLMKSEINIELGTAYLSYLISKFKNISIAICAYNAGEGEVSTWLDENGNLKQIKYAETKA